MFAAEVFMHRFLLKSPVRTLNPEEADWFFVPVYTTCELTPNGLPLPFKSPRMMRSAIQLVASKWPYWNRTEGADHFFVTPHDFGACFHYQVIMSYPWYPRLVRAGMSLVWRSCGLKHWYSNAADKCSMGRVWHLLESKHVLLYSPACMDWHWKWYWVLTILYIFVGTSMNIFYWVPLGRRHMGPTEWLFRGAFCGPICGTWWNWQLL